MAGADDQFEWDDVDRLIEGGRIVDAIKAIRAQSSGLAPCTAIDLIHDRMGYLQEASPSAFTPRQ